MNLKSGVIILTCIIAGTSSQSHSASRGSSDAIEAKSTRAIHVTKMFKFTTKVRRCYCLLFVRVFTHSRRSTQPSFFTPFLSLTFLHSIPTPPHEKVGENKQLRKVQQNYILLLCKVKQILGNNL